MFVGYSELCVSAAGESAFLNDQESLLCFVWVYVDGCVGGKEEPLMGVFCLIGCEGVGETGVLYHTHGRLKCDRYFGWRDSCVLPVLVESTWVFDGCAFDEPLVFELVG